MSIFEIALGIAALVAFILLIYNGIAVRRFHASRCRCTIHEGEGQMTKKIFDEENEALKGITKTKLESKKEWSNH